MPKCLTEHRPYIPPQPTFSPDFLFHLHSSVYKQNQPLKIRVLLQRFRFPYLTDTIYDGVRRLQFQKGIRQRIANKHASRAARAASEVCLFDYFRRYIQPTGSATGKLKAASQSPYRKLTLSRLSSIP
jgi:hypothetical protein